MKEKARQLVRELRKLQEESGITQTDIANILHVTPSAISTRLAGRRSPALTSFLELVDAIGYELVLRKKSEE